MEAAGSATEPGVDAFAYRLVQRNGFQSVDVRGSMPLGLGASSCHTSTTRPRPGLTTRRSIVIPSFVATRWERTFWGWMIEIKLRQIEIGERARADRLRRLGGQPSAPGTAGQPPAELRPGGELRKERRVGDAEKPDELAAQVSVATLYGHEPEPVLLPMPSNALIPSRQSWPVVQIPPDFRVPIDLRHRRFVLFTPATQDQPRVLSSANGIGEEPTVARPQSTRENMTFKSG